ncbi:hypothetical protein BH10ACI1_BH10ACI1_14480 [soil metagenome]
MADKEFCPKCPEPYTWNQESWMNLGCLLMMTVFPLLLIFLFWMFFFMGFLFR